VGSACNTPRSGLQLLDSFSRRGASETRVVIAHARGCIIERRGDCSVERARPSPTLQFMSAWLCLSQAPFPHVAAQVIHAVRADAALIAVAWHGISDAVLSHVALRRRRLVAPWIDGATSPACSFFPLLTGWQRLFYLIGVSARIIPCHEDHGMVLSVVWIGAVIPVLRRMVSGSRYESRVFIVRYGVNIDVVRR
jgi:hypothetical protein